MTATDYPDRTPTGSASDISTEDTPVQSASSTSASETTASDATFFVEQPYEEAGKKTTAPADASADSTDVATPTAETTDSFIDSPFEVLAEEVVDVVGIVEQPPEDFPESFTTDPQSATDPHAAQWQTLQGELQQALAKSAEHWSLYLGARAEMDNLLKRSEREIQNARRFALHEFIGALLPVKDSLEMGIAAAADTTDIAKLREGAELTLKMLTGILEKAGVQELDPTGTKFNPERHEAMAMQPSESFEPNTVLHVVQKGYVLNERLIRPARVILSRTP